LDQPRENARLELDGVCHRKVSILKFGLVLTLRVLLLFVVIMGCFMVAGAVSSLAGGYVASDPAARADSGGAATSLLGALLLLCGLASLVVSSIVLRARTSGGQLALRSPLPHSA
jgi:hypothetical protein